jgi:hypothetical protein
MRNRRRSAEHGGLVSDALGGEPFGVDGLGPQRGQGLFEAFDLAEPDVPSGLFEAFGEGGPAL